VDFGGNAEGPPSLIERESELAAIDAVLESARAGSGTFVLVEGPAGIGKTSLLRAARQGAVARGIRVLHGLGTEFEREYPFGVIRQAFAQTVRSERDRARLLSGAGGLAEPALFDAGDVNADPFGILNGLYWVLAGISEDGAVCLIVDDVQWADEASLRFIGFLARRVESLPVALIVGLRTASDFGSAPAAVRELREHARTYATRLEPRALEVEGVGRLLGSDGRDAIDPVFAEHCHKVTGGNPFLLDELVRALQDQRISPVGEDAARLTQLSVPGVIESVAATLGRLGSAPTAIAQAVAVLGEGAPVDLTRQFAGLTQAQTARAVAELVRAGLFEDGAELRFRHPILGGAVRDGMSVSRRAEDHSRAVELLRERRAPSERVALQLLHVLPARDTRVVEELRHAARHAASRGAPATAAMMLERALDEPPPDDDVRAEVLIDLGRSLIDQGRMTDAGKRLEAALACAGDPLIRGRAAAQLATSLRSVPEERERIGMLIKSTYDQVAPIDRELGLRLRAILVLIGDPPGDMNDLTGATPAEAVFLGTTIFRVMTPDARADDLADLALRGSRQLDALLEEGATGLAFTGISLALRWADRLDEAEQMLTRAVEAARRRGSTSDFAIAMTLRANVHRRAGRLRDAEADARSALPADLEDDWLFGRGVQPLVGCLLEQGRVAEAHKELTAVLDEDDPVPDAPPLLPLVLVRMWVYAALREHRKAMLAWQDAVERAERLRGISASWVEDLVVVADVHKALGDETEARAAADRARDLAETWGTPGARGQAMHAQARVGALDDPTEAIREAADLLAESPVRLEHAKALISLGGILRRDGHRRDSRGPLREGYELAVKCGADALAESARAELRASGVRVRVDSGTGADALTPSEGRIAEMAVNGLTNAEIAQELFLTVKTVEMHLTHVYRKLDIRGRRDLANALSAQV
jgi:DNA-binding CsgD family transcriptional regulator